MRITTRHLPLSIFNAFLALYIATTRTPSETVATVLLRFSVAIILIATTPDPELNIEVDFEVETNKEGDSNEKDN